MNPAHNTFHADFLHSIDRRRRGGVEQADALTASRAFDVYANTGLGACIQALEANFPSVANLLGTTSFRPLAAAYARVHPPTDARLFLYGGGFSGFLDAMEHGSDWPYLAQLAMLDRLWAESHAAADARPLDARRFAAQMDVGGSPVQLLPAPATRWHFSRTMPIWDLWVTSRSADYTRSAIPWRAQGILLTRPDDAVLTHPLDVAGYAFITACARGLPLAECVEAAMTADADVDLQPLLAMLFVQGAFAESTPLTHLSRSA